MNQNPDENFGIPLDLSASYPIERKGDGKPIEGDMEGVCIYPNTDAILCRSPGKYEVRGQYNGKQIIMTKYADLVPDGGKMFSTISSGGLYR